MMVGRSIHKPQVTVTDGVYVGQYMQRSRVLLTAEDVCFKYWALPTRMITDTLYFQLWLMARLADQVDAYAQQHFSPAVLEAYYRSIPS